MLRRLITTILLFALIAVSCSSDDGPSATPEPEPRVPSGSLLPDTPPDGGAELPDGQPEATAPEAEQQTPNEAARLVVQTADSQLYTMQLDGEDRIELTTDPNYINVLPSWAPDGSSIAWARFERGSETTRFVATDTFDVTELIEIPLDSRPVYLSWDPSSQRIASLSTAVTGFDLEVVDFATEDGEDAEIMSRRLDRGAPYYFDWGPDGDELFVHASGFRLDRIDLEGSTLIVEEFPGDFQAPTWSTAEGQSVLLYGDEIDGVSYLVSSGLDGEGRFPLLAYNGYLLFTASPNGSRIAVQVVDSSEDPGVVAASAPAIADSDSEVTLAAAQVDDDDEDAEPEEDPFDPFAQPVPQIDNNMLYIVGIFGGEPFPVSRDPSLGFFLNEEGDALAWFEFNSSDPDLFDLWINFEGQSVLSATFRPSDAFRNNYLPFFDQFAHSHAFFSPDGRQFIFPGSIDGEPDGIWVVDINQPSAAPERIDDGVFAAFSFPDGAPSDSAARRV